MSKIEKVLVILAVVVLGGMYLLKNYPESFNTDDVYARVQVPLVDGGQRVITIPYSRPDKAEYAKKVITSYPETERKIVEELLAKNYHGEKTDAGNWHWVDVVNINPVQQNFRNGWSWLAYGETCGAGHSDYGDGHVIEGGTIQVRGEANGKVLYEYTARGNPMGTPCPSGVLFFVEKEGR